MKALVLILFLTGCGSMESGNCYVWGEDCTRGKDGRDGRDGQDGEQGPPGTNGRDGVDGASGQPGQSCSIIETGAGVEILCPDGTTGRIYNGKDGKNGTDGIDGAPGPQGEQGESGADGTSISFVIPCPEIESDWPETLMCVNGKLYSTYGSGSRVRIVELAPGEHETRDGRHCEYHVAADCHVY